MKVEVMHDAFEKNRAVADQTRALLNGHGVRAFNLMGAPGCGKTALLEAVLPELLKRHGCAVLEGDPATTLDAERIAAVGVPVMQLVTDGCCHLEPNFVRNALQRLDLSGVRLLFIENVGNLVCPANFDIGEHHRLVVLSVTEGTDKAAKYPGMFSTADAVVISKTDLLPYCDFDPAAATRFIRRANQRAAVLEVSARTRRGMGALVEWIEGQLAPPPGQGPAPASAGR